MYSLNLKNKLLTVFGISTLSLISACQDTGVTGGSIDTQFGGIRSIVPMSPSKASINWDRASKCESYDLNLVSNGNISKVFSTGLSPAIYSQLTPGTSHTFNLTCVQSGGSAKSSENVAFLAWPTWVGDETNLSITTIAPAGQASLPYLQLNWKYINEPLIYHVMAKEVDSTNWTVRTTPSLDRSQEICAVTGNQAKISTNGDANCNPGSKLTQGALYRFKVIVEYPDGSMSTDASNYGVVGVYPSDLKTPDCQLQLTNISESKNLAQVELLCNGAPAVTGCTYTVQGFQNRRDTTGSGSRTAISQPLTLSGSGFQTLTMNPQFLPGQPDQRTVDSLEIEFSCGSQKKIFALSDQNKVRVKYPTEIQKAIPSSADANPSYLGRSVTVGDFNCDGEPDLVTGVPDATFNSTPYFNTNPSSGYIVIHYSYARASGGQALINSSPTQQIISFQDLPAYSRFGAALTTVNLNRDYSRTQNNIFHSCDDLVIGAPGTAEAYIFYGNTAGLSRPLSRPRDFNSPTCSGSSQNANCGVARLAPRPVEDYGAPYNPQWSNFGAVLANAGDFNGDGYGDLAVGCPTCDYQTTPTDRVDYAGAVFVYYGGTFGLNSVVSINSRSGTYSPIYSPDRSRYGRFGSAIAGQALFTHRAPNRVQVGSNTLWVPSTDLVIGAPTESTDSNKSNQAGKVYVLKGRDNTGSIETFPGSVALSNYTDDRQSNLFSTTTSTTYDVSAGFTCNTATDCNQSRFYTFSTGINFISGPSGQFNFGYRLATLGTIDDNLVAIAEVRNDSSTPRVYTAGDYGNSQFVIGGVRGISPQLGSVFPWAFNGTLPFRNAIQEFGTATPGYTSLKRRHVFFRDLNQDGYSDLVISAQSGTNHVVNTYFGRGDSNASNPPLTITGTGTACTSASTRSTTSGSGPFGTLDRFSPAASTCAPQTLNVGTSSITGLAAEDLENTGSVNLIVGTAAANSNQGEVKIYGGIRTFAGTTQYGYTSGATLNTTTTGELGSSVTAKRWVFMGQDTFAETLASIVVAGAPRHSQGQGGIFSALVTMPWLSDASMGIPTQAQPALGLNPAQRGAAIELYAARTRAVGDVNGDGYDDIVTPIKRLDANGSVYYDAVIYFGSELGPITYERCLELGQNDGDCRGGVNFNRTNLVYGNRTVDIILPKLFSKPMWLRSGDSLLRLVRVGDVNNDGYEDLLLNDTQGDGTLGFYLVLGAALGPNFGEISSITPPSLASENGLPQRLTRTAGASGLSGSNLDQIDLSNPAYTVGDYNGDGFADLALGLPGSSSPGKTGGWPCSVDKSTITNPNDWRYPYCVQGVGAQNHGQVIVLFGSASGYNITGNNNQTGLVMPSNTKSNGTTPADADYGELIDNYYRVIAHQQNTVGTTTSSTSPIVIKNPLFKLAAAPLEANADSTHWFLTNQYFGGVLASAKLSSNGPDSLVIGGANVVNTTTSSSIFDRGHVLIFNGNTTTGLTHSDAQLDFIPNSLHQNFSTGTVHVRPISADTGGAYNSTGSWTGFGAQIAAGDFNGDNVDELYVTLPTGAGYVLNANATAGSKFTPITFPEYNTATLPNFNANVFSRERSLKRRSFARGSLFFKQSDGSMSTRLRNGIQDLFLATPSIVDNASGYTNGNTGMGVVLYGKSEISLPQPAGLQVRSPATFADRSITSINSGLLDLTLLEASKSPTKLKVYQSNVGRAFSNRVTYGDFDGDGTLDWVVPMNDTNTTAIDDSGNSTPAIDPGGFYIVY